MKRLLLISSGVCLWIGMVFFSCADGGKTGKNASGNGSDTTGKSRSSAGNSVNSGQTNTVNPGRDTTLRYQKEIRNNGPNQARLDSIKAEKTKKKK